MPANKLIYLSHYPQHLQTSIQTLIEKNKLADYLRAKYPTTHQINSDAALRDYIPVLLQAACFRAITALSIQGILVKECRHLSNQYNAVVEAL